MYGMRAAIEGDAQIGSIAVPVAVSISDLFDALKFGAMAAYRIENVVWSFSGDVGGFGIGSDPTWHMITTFRQQNTERFGWYLGYRVIAYDYDDGNGWNYQHYDLRQHGPGIGDSNGF